MKILILCGRRLKNAGWSGEQNSIGYNMKTKRSYLGSCTAWHGMHPPTHPPTLTTALHRSPKNIVGATSAPAVAAKTSGLTKKNGTFCQMFQVCELSRTSALPLYNQTRKSKQARILSNSSLTFYFVDERSTRAHKVRISVCLRHFQDHGP